jgi:hypothetical protein
LAAVLQWAYDEGGRIMVSSSTVRNVESNQELLNLDEGACRITWNATAEQFELKAATGTTGPHPDWSGGNAGLHRSASAVGFRHGGKTKWRH